MSIQSALVSFGLGAVLSAAGSGYLVYQYETGQMAKLKLQYAQAETRAVQEAKSLQAGQDQVSMDKALAFANAHERIQIRTVETVRKVPVYVTAKTDAAFPLPCGFVRVHDASALGVDPADIPNPAGKSDGDSCEVKASEAAGIIAENYGAADQWREQLIGLQDWVSAEKSQADSASAQH